MVPLEPGLGLIEGFYGRQWRPVDRLDTLGFLARSGYRYYVYAPKGDATLRRRWREHWGAGESSHLRELAATARGLGLAWGVGLSPLGLVEDPGPGLRDLGEKLDYLGSFGPDLLCLLFDDMPRGVEDLAERQLDVVRCAMDRQPARHLVVCPSYYSRDPVLERLFGAMPEGYWDTLGRGLPPSVGVFWTGERVCSPGYAVDELRSIGRHFRRPVTLWDNYPVNDGARASDFLHLDAFRNRPSGLRDVTQAHFVNPMNQCHLSRIPLLTLARARAQGEGYDPDAALAAALREVAGEQGGAFLAEDLAALQSVGRKALGAAEVAALLARYAGFEAPWAEELRDWLGGGYAFDPACLTD